MKEIKPKKSNQISVRMTPLERMLIESRARSSGYTLSRFLVEAAMGREMKIVSAEEKQLYKDLANYHTNFARLSNLVRGKDPGLFNEIQTVLREINKILVQINGK